MMNRVMMNRKIKLEKKETLTAVKVTLADGTILNGYFSDLRVDTKLLPKKWYKYSISNLEDKGYIAKISKWALCNHLGDMLTRKPIESLESADTHISLAVKDFEYDDNDHKEFDGKLWHKYY